jgi:hypothetical protein
MPAPGAVAVVTAHVWRVPAGQLPRTLLALAADRRHVRHTPGVGFAKLLGTSRLGHFAISSADLRRWALITSWASVDEARRFDQSRVVSGWAHRAEETWTATLRPLLSHGRWSRREAFGRPRPTSWTGPVAAITRARIRPGRLAAFWRAVPAVNAGLAGRPGLCLAFGMGEAPIGVQGTFSVWRDVSELTRFAFRDEAHRAVMDQADREDWFAEALFARFGVLDTGGTIDGVNPVAGPS